MKKGWSKYALWMAWCMVMLAASAQAAPRAVGQPAAMQRIIENQASPGIIFLFASWCPHCNTVVPAVNELASRYGTHLGVIGVSQEEDPEALEQFMRRRGVAFPVFHARRGVLKALYPQAELGRIPTYILIDEKGELIASGNYSMKQLARFMEKMHRAAASHDGPDTQAPPMGGGQGQPDYQGGVKVYR